MNTSDRSVIHLDSALGEDSLFLESIRYYQLTV